MPRALDPNCRFPLCLQSDMAQPEGERPTFYARYLTGREWNRISELQDGEPTSVDALIAPTYAALRIGIVHWNNLRGRDGVAIPFDLSKLEEILDPGEARELVMAMMRGAALGISDPKGCASPSLSSSGSSAQSAPGDA